MLWCIGCIPHPKPIPNNLPSLYPGIMGFKSFFPECLKYFKAFLKAFRASKAFLRQVQGQGRSRQARLFIRQGFFKVLKHFKAF